MAKCEIALLFTMKHEDYKLEGLVITDNNGGMVRFGINSKANPQAVTDGYYTMAKLEAWAYATKFFLTNYWTPAQGDQIDSQTIANKIMDLGFNMGLEEIVKLTQRAINFLIGEAVLMVDGDLGPKTLTQINAWDSTRLLLAIKGYAKHFYEELVVAHPEDQKYLDGWLTRVNL